MSNAAAVARTIVKRAIERTLVGSGLARLHRRRMRDRVLILAYHNVVDDESIPAGDLANHLPLSSFRFQLDVLRSTVEVVSLAEAFEERDAAHRRQRVVITFDDAYRGAVLLAVPELVDRSMPATIFVAPERLGDQQFWWDSLAAPGAGLDPELRDHALGPLRGRQELVLHWASGTGRHHSVLPAELHSCTVDELGRAARAPGITLGSHSWSHANLARLDDASLADELGRSLEWVGTNRKSRKVRRVAPAGRRTC